MECQKIPLVEAIEWYNLVIAKLPSYWDGMGPVKLGLDVPIPTRGNKSDVGTNELDLHLSHIADMAPFFVFCLL